MPSPRWEGAFEQYLSRYAHAPECWVSDDMWLGRRYEAAAVVPAFDEHPDFVRRLLSSAPSSESVLLIVVVNFPATATREQRRRTRSVVRVMTEHNCVGVSQEGALTLVEDPLDLGVDVLLLDAERGQQGLAPGEGVGKARKLGFDLACRLLQSGVVRGVYCGSVDADVRLPPRYWSTLVDEGRSQGLPAASALLFGYRHLPHGDATTDRVMRQVELHFRLYCLGLAHAGSPYAYHALGSAIAVSLPHYGLARGFPNRQAGEDFYLLEKIGRLAPLLRVGDVVIDIATRVSHRVPFGTGPLLSTHLDASREPVQTYDPRVYSLLRGFLRDVEAWATGALAMGAIDHPVLSAHANRLAVRASQGLGQCKTAERKRRRIHDSFGALSTLQLVRDLSEEAYPRVDVELAARRLIVPNDERTMNETRGEIAAPVGTEWIDRAVVIEKGLPLQLGPARPSCLQPLDIYVEP